MAHDPTGKEKLEELFLSSDYEAVYMTICVNLRRLDLTPIDVGEDALSTGECDHELQEGKEPCGHAQEPTLTHFGNSAKVKLSNHGVTQKDEFYSIQRPIPRDLPLPSVFGTQFLIALGSYKQQADPNQLPELNKAARCEVASAFVEDWMVRKQYFK